jgi:hypothetical protein
LRGAATIGASQTVRKHFDVSDVTVLILALAGTRGGADSRSPSLWTDQARHLSLGLTVFSTIIIYLLFMATFDIHSQEK